MTKHDPYAKSRIDAMLVPAVKSGNSVAPLMTRIAEVARCEAVKSLGAVPDGCGFDGAIPHAPARGPVEVFSPREVMRTEAGNFRIVRTGYMGATALRRADAFDVMEAQAARQAKARNKDHQPRFTTAQVEAGRTYGHLAERHDAIGARCSSMEGQSRGAGGGSYIDAVVAEGRRLERMRAAIGQAWAMEPKRTAPHADRRRAISVRTIVDMVCIEGRTLSDVLDRFGWSRKTTHVAEVRAHLCAALDRIHGL
jgi:hypothetical protein